MISFYSLRGYRGDNIIYHGVVLCRVNRSELGRADYVKCKRSGRLQSRIAHAQNEDKTSKDRTQTTNT